MGLLLHPPDLLRQLAHVVPRAPPFAGEPRRELLHAPLPHQVLDDGAVVRHRVRPGLLGEGHDAGVEVVAAAVGDGRGRHGDPSPQHARHRAHAGVRVGLEEPGDDAGVGGLVPLLVGGDGAADAGEGGVAVPSRADQPRRVAVGDRRGALLERRVDEGVVRAARRVDGHAGADEAVHGALHLGHVEAAGEVHVPVEHVAVAVLLGGPPADPPRPRRGVGAGEVADGADAVQRALVRGQRLLRHHVRHEAHQEQVRHAGGALPQLGARRVEPLAAEHRRVREQVRRLPRRLHRLQQRQHVLLHPRLHLRQHLQLLRRQVAPHLLVFLPPHGGGDVGRRRHDRAATDSTTPAHPACMSTTTCKLQLVIYFFLNQLKINLCFDQIDEIFGKFANNMSSKGVHICSSMQRSSFNIFSKGLYFLHHF
uniref:Uncharacterized protein n=1 Tax=Oryza nivara TaxID=4536 RepID=A0A0E0I872_ORYNI